MAADRSSSSFPRRPASNPASYVNSRVPGRVRSRTMVTSRRTPAGKDRAFTIRSACRYTTSRPALSRRSTSRSGPDLDAPQLLVDVIRVLDALRQEVVQVIGASAGDRGRLGQPAAGRDLIESLEQGQRARLDRMTADRPLKQCGPDRSQVVV